MAACYWRLRRAMAMEKCLLDEALDKSLDSHAIPNLGKVWDQIGDSPKLLHLHRYQVMLNRMHHRALSNLLMLRDMFPDDAELPIEPSPISGHSAATPPPDPPAPSTDLPPSEPVGTSAGLPSPKSTVATHPVTPITRLPRLRPVTTAPRDTPIFTASRFARVRRAARLTTHVGRARNQR
jgi:hypothetical protein